MARGFVFSIDATLGVFVAVLMLATAIFLSAQAQEDPYGKLQLTRLARDSLNSMDQRGVLAQGNRSVIEEEMNATFVHGTIGNTTGIGTNLLIDTYFYDSGDFTLLNSSEYGEGVPADKDTYGIRHDFVAVENSLLINFSVARMTIWQR